MTNSDIDRKTDTRMKQFYQAKIEKKLKYLHLTVVFLGVLQTKHFHIDVFGCSFVHTKRTFSTQI
jgi:hypothetical protein